MHGTIEPPSKAALLDVVDKASAFAKISEDRQAHLLPRSAKTAPKPLDAARKNPLRHAADPHTADSLEPSGQKAQNAAALDTALDDKPVSPTEAPMGYMSEVRVAGSVLAVQSTCSKSC